MKSGSMKISKENERLLSSAEKGAISSPLNLRDLVLEKESGAEGSVSPLARDQGSREFETELEILKGHMMLLEKMTQKKSFLLREVKYLLKVNS